MKKKIKIKKKIQYSKIITLLTFILFCICIIKCFSVDISTAYDLSLYVAIITSSGALCLTSVVWYLKNSQAEKVARIKADTYRIISEERFKYNKKMFELKSKYGYSNEDIDEIENDSPLDELEQDALDSLNSSIDNAMEEAVSSIEIQTI
jgi:hypothetical protein